MDTTGTGGVEQAVVVGRVPEHAAELVEQRAVSAECEDVVLWSNEDSVHGVAGNSAGEVA